jgi:hypothetical protein
MELYIMKHWNSLNDLETQLIKLETTKSLITMVCNSFDTTHMSDIKNSLYLVEDYIVDLVKNTNEKYETLFANIRNEQGTFIFTSMKEADELSEVIYNWIKPKFDTV